MTTPSSIEERIAHLEGSFEQIERRLGTLEQDIRGLRTEMNARIDRLEASLSARIDRLEARLDRLFYGLLAAVAASILATVLTRLL